MSEWLVDLGLNDNLIKASKETEKERAALKASVNDHKPRIQYTKYLFYEASLGCNR